MLTDYVICRCVHGRLGFFSGTFRDGAWSMRFDEAAKYDPNERPFAEQFAASHGAKVVALDRLAARYPVETLPVECSETEFGDWH